MEAVNEFKSEVCCSGLSRVCRIVPIQVNSLYETRLPVSRAKISQITKLALKAVKVSHSGVSCDPLTADPCYYSTINTWL